VLIAGGILGYGETVPRGLDLSLIGAVVVGPLTGQSRAGASQPRLAETLGGFVLETGLQNRGLASVLAKFAKQWPRLGCPVVAQVAEADARSLARLVSRLAETPGLGGLELLPLTDESAAAARLVRAASQASDLPVWVKLSLAEAETWAASMVEAGASGLVVGQPLRAALRRETGTAESRLVQGALYGPLAFAPMLARLAAVAALGLPCALIACGGIHSVEQARQALDCGAQAVQVDSVLWVEPAAASWIAAGLAADARRATTGGTVHAR
jgi:dihydroorotate dehydrogenase